MRRFKQLNTELRKYLTKEQIKEIYRAYEFGAKAHHGQKRSSGEPYITHPLQVATILAQMRMDKNTIVAAILHDVIEDTDIDKSTIITQFGQEVADLVDGVTKLTQIRFESKAQAQAENFRKMILAMVRDVRVIIIKLADRLHNMRTLGGLPAYKQRRIAKETFEIHAPVAHRLGMHKLCVELQDLAFAALYPHRYRVLQRAVKQSRGNRQEVIKEVTNKLKKTLKDCKIRVVSIEGREKHLYSIYKKMKAKHLSFHEIMDVYAFRIIVENRDDCYRVLGVAHNLYKPVPERFKDYIAIQKTNHYRALHTSLFGPSGLPIEIQIRTIEMHQIAEEGIASHWIYKSNESEINQAQIQAGGWFKGLLDIQENTGNPIEFIENVKIDLFPDEVYVFTPKGDILELPMGATPVDFAYLVHSDVGNSCVAAKIDRRLFPLSTPLTNGQTVEIVIAPGARPNPAWLNFVVTGKARSKIRHYLNQQKREDSIKLGKHLLQNSLEDLGVPYDSLRQEHIDAVLQQSNYTVLEDLLEHIGLGNQPAPIIARRLAGNFPKEEDEVKAARAIQPLIIRGSEGVLVHFADCCRPIPGDPITGIFTTGKGLEIHTEQCPRMLRLKKKSDKIVPVRWEDKLVSEFQADVWLEIANQRGVLAKLTKAIADAESNIENIEAFTREENFGTVHLTVMVRDRVHLARVMRRIRSIKSVIRLMRYTKG